MTHTNMRCALLSVIVSSFYSIWIATPAVGQVRIDLEEVEISPDGMTTMNVVISPNGVPSQQMNEFSVDFLINNDAATPGSRLEFVTQSTTEDFETDPNYVFSGVSFARLGSAPNFPPNQPINTLLPQFSSPNDSLTSTDVRFDFMDIALNAPRLLTQLKFLHVAGNSPLDTIGDSFSVIVEASDISTNGGATIITSVGDSGRVTVADVPEPGAFFMCAALSAFVAIRRRRRG